MNLTPRSRTIELISLNTSRGVWNWRIVWASPRVNVASRRLCALSIDTSSAAFTWIPKLERRWFALYRRPARSNFAGTVNPSHPTTNPVTVPWGSCFIVVSNPSVDPNFSASGFLKTSRVPSIASPASTSPLWISVATSRGAGFAAGSVFSAPFGGAFSSGLSAPFAAGFAPALPSGFFGGDGAALGSSFFQNLKGIPGRRSGGRIIRFADRNPEARIETGRSTNCPSPALSRRAIGVRRTSSRRIRGGEPAGRPLERGRGHYAGPRGDQRAVGG